MLKIENEQLSSLNRKLTEDVMAYKYKDTLKEAQYIIEGQFNKMLAPQKYKYLLEESMLLYFVNNSYRARISESVLIQLESREKGFVR